MEETTIYMDGSGVGYVGELPKLNIDLLRECVDWAKSKSGLNGFPLWNQTTWHNLVDKGHAYRVNNRKREADYCGAAFCMAGYATYVSGASQSLWKLYDENKITTEELRWDRGIDVEIESSFIDDAMSMEQTDPNMVGYDGNLVNPNVTKWGEISWRSAAQALLGLTNCEADALFNGDNRIGDVKRISASIAESRGLTL